jgi:CBS domain-containing protein
MPNAAPTTFDLPAAVQAHPVFGHLGAAAQGALCGQLQLQTAAFGTCVADGPALLQRLGWALAGDACWLHQQHDTGARLHAGDLFGYGAAPHDDPQDWSVVAGDGLQLAWLPAAALAAWRAESPLLQALLAAPHAAGLAPPAAAAADPHLGLLTMPVQALIKRAPVSLPPTASIREAAQLMKQQRVSCVLIVQDGQLFGLVTDRDLRNRVLAEGLDSNRPVVDITTLAPLCVDLRAPGFDALLLMTRHNIHHVPVRDGSTVVGMVTATDLTEQHSTSAVVLVSNIRKQDDLAGLVAASAKVGPLQRQLAAAQASAHATGHIITAITDAITVKLLQMAEAALGPPPVEYAWVAAGSQARSEQTARSDQDNCMILDDRYDEVAHGAYFQALAQQVNAGLDACGYVFCPGEMMARTDQWRQPQRRWAAYFRQWTQTPDPTALMLTCVFFDLRLIHGRASLLDDLRREVLQQTRANRIFLAHMVGNALKHRPPLGLFGMLSTIRSGEHRDTIDLKHSGIVPIVDLARYYALASGHAEVNTQDRLAIAPESKEISAQTAHDLRDALEFVSTLRIRHQARQLGSGGQADNFMAVREISHLERSQLKDAFNVVQTVQTLLAQRYR